jgi:hypothetical protein
MRRWCHIRVQAWGRNVTDKYYWRGVAHHIDTITRYTGMPATYGFLFSYRY